MISETKVRICRNAFPRFDDADVVHRPAGLKRIPLLWYTGLKNGSLCCGTPDLKNGSLCCGTPACRIESPNPSPTAIIKKISTIIIIINPNQTMSLNMKTLTQALAKTTAVIEKTVQTMVQEVTGPKPLQDYDLLDQIGSAGPGLV
ncbi:hypothetical protein LOK49_LG09G01553 [Camellia lanceoleosa]|uniref:Uncharacterized protein n=1 Tax=Camellia lanceoleosa TaxID=1840588 RepID=A0ACC0GIN7_9ERIC|nr:hypothetical protein LOK49_LG09G01553 [Camellia lanceoleosa]